MNLSILIDVHTSYCSTLLLQSFYERSQVSYAGQNYYLVRRKDLMVTGPAFLIHVYTILQTLDACYMCDCQCSLFPGFDVRHWANMPKVWCANPAEGRGFLLLLTYIIYESELTSFSCSLQ